MSNAYINNPRINILKKIDTAQIEQAVTLMKSIRNSHNVLCEKKISPPVLDSITKYSKEIDGKHFGKYVYFNKREPVNTMEEFCTSRSMKLVELREHDDKVAFEHFLQKFNIPEVLAGIEYDNQVREYVYRSDKKEINYYLISPPIANTPRGTWTIGWPAALSRDDSDYFHHSYLQYYIKDGKITIMINSEKSTPKNKMTYFGMENIRTMPAVCQVLDEQTEKTPVNYEDSFNNICSTTEIGFNSSISWVENALSHIDPKRLYDYQEQIESSGINIQADQPILDNSQDTREKRGAIVATLAAGLPIAGKILGGLGAVSKLAEFIRKEDDDEVEKLIPLINQNSAKISQLISAQEVMRSQLELMQAKIDNLIENIQSQVFTYTRAVHQQSFLKSEFDIVFIEAQKAIELLTHLYSTDKIPIHEFLTPSELSSLSNFLSQNNSIQIDTQYKSIIAQVSMSETEYHILFSIPIMERQSYATLYRYIPLPIFYESNTYTATSEYQYVGIFHFKDIESYIPLSKTDFEKCVTFRHCNPQTPIHKKHHKTCGISNYYSHGNECSYTISNGYVPKILTVKDTTYVVTEDKIKFDKRCQRLSNSPPDTRSIEVKGIAKIHLSPNCKLINENFTILPTYQIQSLNKEKVEEYKIEYETVDSNMPSMIKIYTENHQAYENKINFEILQKEVDLTPLYVVISLISILAFGQICYFISIFVYKKYLKTKVNIPSHNDEEENEIEVSFNRNYQRELQEQEQNSRTYRSGTRYDHSD